MVAPTLNVIFCHNRNSFFNDHDMSLYDPFSVSQFAPLALLWRKHSNDTSQTFISNSTLFVSIFTLTKTGGCWIFYSGLHKFHMQDSVEKISKEIPWIFSLQKFLAVSIHWFYLIENLKSPLWPKYISRITSQISFSHEISPIPYPILTQVCIY